MTKTDQEGLLVDLVDILKRNVPEDVEREDVYIELMNLFEETVLAGAIGDDSVFDRVYKSTFQEYDEDEDE